MRILLLSEKYFGKEKNILKLINFSLEVSLEK